MPNTLILASASPRRAELLRQIGCTFDIIPADIDERVDASLTPGDVALTLAKQKAAEISARYPTHVVLGADTIVVIDNNILGKPETPQEACSMLRLLSGRTHTVYTGYSLRRGADEIAEVVATAVTFRILSNEEIERYVRTGSPMDKAGAYGIQEDLGAVFVERIDGDYYTVVGLPLARVYLALKQFRVIE